ncbi:Stk1 family PASTA domain-containing Ser/Thr kinase [Nocardioides aurantiacus]|uniref:non-specific serine/threonine protein kinase n=1 Tax=Nocardioides aurantiacus TaxID=86796 RepID=A0A3N2CWZ0_9ACTN|nr:serine/threonine-protein kinase [Nocardioides aurantiacus]
MDRTRDALTGRVLDGRYRLGARIARGGMATVHEAVDLRLDRPVAVKVMHEGLAADDEFVRRFQREARSAARLSDPHVTAVFDTGDDDGTLFLVMELVPGRTLRDLIRSEAPVQPARALALVEPVLSALAAAHRAGIVHRDVKPENVLLADDGRVKVADFGLSRAVNAETQHSATGGVLIGTVSYLAPELVVDGTADARTDVYAAGVVLFELLTGSKPHQAENPIQVAYKHVHEDVPPPSSRVPGLPAYLDALVARATSREPALRPADAQVLLQQVRRVRLALDQGVLEDDELTTDLAPVALARSAGGVVEELDAATTDEIPDILAPAEAARAARSDLTDRADLTDSADDHEHTRTVRRDDLGVDTVYDQEQDRSPDGSGGRGALLAPPRPPQQRRGDDGVPGWGSERLVGGPGGDGRDEDHDDEWPHERRHRRGRGPVALLLVLLLAAGAAGAGWWFGVGRYTDAPAVLGLSQAAAESRLEAAGLDLRVGDPAYSETVPRGRIVATDPEPGGRVLQDGTVVAVLSRGPERHDVPAVAGRTLDAAQQALLDARLGFGEAVERFSPEVPKGQVVTSDPVAGTALRRDAAVDLVVSKGPRPITVRDWTGEDADEAQAALEKRGFEVEVSEENSDSVDAETVIGQSPDSGTAFKGDTVELTVSKGPVLVEVPDVVRMGVAAATARLEAAGFDVEVEESSLYIGVQYVVATDPGAGGRAPRGSTVTLSIV